MYWASVISHFHFDGWSRLYLKGADANRGGKQHCESVILVTVVDEPVLLKEELRMSENGAGKSWEIAKGGWICCQTDHGHHSGTCVRDIFLDI